MWCTLLGGTAHSGYPVAPQVPETLCPHVQELPFTHCPPHSALLDYCWVLALVIPFCNSSLLCRACPLTLQSFPYCLLYPYSLSRSYTKQFFTPDIQNILTSLLLAAASIPSWDHQFFLPLPKNPAITPIQEIFPGSCFTSRRETSSHRPLVAGEEPVRKWCWHRNSNQSKANTKVIRRTSILHWKAETPFHIGHDTRVDSQEEMQKLPSFWLNTGSFGVCMRALASGPAVNKAGLHSSASPT